MFRKLSIPLMATALSILTFVACDELEQANDRFETLSRGKATLAACIAEQCEVLNIDGMRLEDYSALNDLTHVTVLMASRTDFDDLTDINNMPQLKELHITLTGITDLTGLQNFPQLKVLHIENMSPGVDISPIGQLTNLTELALGNLGKGNDASFIQNMPRLEKLKISWAGANADISILTGHPSLHTIDIYGNLPADQSTLLTLPALRRIFFGSGNTLAPEIRQQLEDRGVLDQFMVMVVC